MNPTGPERVLLAEGQMDYGQLIWACGLLIGLMLLTFFGVAWLRRRVRNGQDGEATEAFTLDELRTLHREGQLSEEEYTRAQQQLAARFGLGPVAGRAKPDSGGRHKLPPR